MGNAAYEQTGVRLPDPEPSLLEEPQDGQQDDGRPEFLLEQFDSVEAQARAYDEARKEMARAQSRADASERAVENLAQQVDELRQAQQQQPQPQAQGGYDAASDPFLLAEAQAYEDGDYNRAIQLRDMRMAQMLQAAQQMWQQQAQPAQPDQHMFAMLTEQEVARQIGDDWGDLREEVSNVLRENPHFVPATTDPAAAAKAVVFVAEGVRARRLTADQSAGGQQRADQAKRLAQTAPGTAGRPATGGNPADEWAARMKQVPRPYWAQQ